METYRTYFKDELKRSQRSAKRAALVLTGSFLASMSIIVYSAVHTFTMPS